MQLAVCGGWGNGFWASPLAIWPNICLPLTTGRAFCLHLPKKKKKREKKKLILLASLLGRMINGPLDTVRESGEATDPSYGLKTIIVFNKKCMLIIAVPGGIKGRDWRVIKIDMRKS